MKTIFTLLASTILSASVFAADVRPSSSITIQSAGKSDIIVVLDGKRFDPSDNAIVISGVEEGLHTLKVVKAKPDRGFNNRKSVLYNGQVDMKRSTSLSIRIDLNGFAQFVESRISNSPVYGNNGGYNSNQGWKTSMNDREFDQVLENIDKAWLESNKLKAATQILNTNTVSVDQVKQLMSLFSFEANKLQVAKSAYRNTVDKQNYDEVVETLSFENNQYELERFMKTSR